MREHLGPVTCQVRPVWNGWLACGRELVVSEEQALLSGCGAACGPRLGLVNRELDLGVCPPPCDLGVCPLCWGAPLVLLASLHTWTAGPPPRDREPAQISVTGSPGPPLQVPPPPVTGPRQPQDRGPPQRGPAGRLTPKGLLPWSSDPAPCGVRPLSTTAGGPVGLTQP